MFCQNIKVRGVACDWGSISSLENRKTENVFFGPLLQLAKSLPFAFLFPGAVFAKILQLDKLPRLTPSKLRMNRRKKGARSNARMRHEEQLPRHSKEYQRQRPPSPYSDRPRNFKSTGEERFREDEFERQHVSATYSGRPDAQAEGPPCASGASSVTGATGASWSDAASFQVVEPPPPPRTAARESRAEKLKREYKEMAKRQEKVWDEVDQRWVVVGDKRSVSPRPTTSTSPVPPVNDLLAPVDAHSASSSAPPQKVELGPSAKIQGVKLDASNAVGKSSHVASAIRKRVEEMEEAQVAAKKELRDREDKKKMEAEELEAVRGKLEPRLKAWCEEYGKKRQLRALLSSLDKVLWEDSGWKPLSLGDVLNPKQARKWYLKASLKVHPDKTHGLDAEKRFIANRVFDALSQANSVFEENGGK